MNALRAAVQTRALLHTCQFWALDIHTTAPLFLYARKRNPTILRNYSSGFKERLRSLSDVETYVERDFTLSDLQRKFDEENLPAPVTTTSLLNECETIYGVLEELKNAALAGKLWKDEITLYFDALKRLKREIDIPVSENEYNLPENVDECEVVKQFQIQELHGNPYFQYAIKEALVHSPQFPTGQLTSLLHSFVVLEIPPESNTMVILVAIIQNRINDLFPRDVLMCLLSIHGIKSDGLAHIESLSQGLLKHLENQTIDEPTLKRILMATPVSNRMDLLRLISSNASRDLKFAIYRSVLETLGRRQQKDLKNLREAESVLRCCAKTALPGTVLLNSVVKYFMENKHKVTDRHRDMISVVRQNQYVEYFNLPHYLEVTN